MSKYKSIKLDNYFYGKSELEIKENSKQFLELMKKRRTVRDFSEDAVDIEIIKNCIKIAGSAPNGANLQPWHFAVVSDSKIKRQIRLLAEEEEKKFYSGKAPDDWLDVLEPLGTNDEKPFLESAPHLIVIFEKKYGINENGQKVKHYYTKESVGIATGFLITALHYSGLASLTHTPSPMNFLNKILNRPVNEKPYLILVVGHPKKEVEVPDIQKKPIEEFTTFY